MRRGLLLVPVVVLATTLSSCGGSDGGTASPRTPTSPAASPAGPSSGSPSSGTGTPAPSGAASSASTPQSSAAVPTRAASVTPTPLSEPSTDLSGRRLPEVVSPSRHIACMFSGAARPSVRCDVDGARWRVATPEDCPGAYGDSVELRSGRARMVCHTDTVLDPHIHDAVPYGSAVTFHGLTCKSRRTGMTCTDGDGHGFTVSRESHRLF